MADHQPDYNVYFERDDIDGALVCLDIYGYCVIRKMIDQLMVQILKDAIDVAVHISVPGAAIPSSVSPIDAEHLN